MRETIRSRVWSESEALAAQRPDQKYVSDLHEGGIRFRLLRPVRIPRQPLQDPGKILVVRF